MMTYIQQSIYYVCMYVHTKDILLFTSDFKSLEEI